MNSCCLTATSVAIALDIEIRPLNLQASDAPGEIADPLYREIRLVVLAYAFLTCALRSSEMKKSVLDMML